MAIADGAVRAIVLGRDLEIARLRSRISELEYELVRNEVLLAGMTEALIIADASGKIVLMDAAALSLYEFSSLDEARRNQTIFAELFEARSADGRLIPADEWPLARAARGESFPYVDIHFQHRRTGKSWVGSYSAGPIRNWTGQVILVALVIRNITRRDAGPWTSVHASEDRSGSL